MALRATLLTDGASDRALLPMLRWLLADLTREEIDLRWADLRLLRSPAQALAERIAAAVSLQPCDLLFVHRDAESRAPEPRYREIRAAHTVECCVVCVVPVTMLEAWMLLDEASLRRAAGRPSGRSTLDLPPARRWDTIANPKKVLHEALRRASGLTGRRARAFSPEKAAHRLADLVTDWSPLRALDAFRRLEDDTRQALQQL